LLPEDAGLIVVLRVCLVSGYPGKAGKQWAYRIPDLIIDVMVFQPPSHALSMIRQDIAALGHNAVQVWVRLHTNDIEVMRERFERKAWMSRYVLRSMQKVDAYCTSRRMSVGGFQVRRLE
jgi:hypothetical protein